MNSEDFKRSFDALTFSSDFNEKTTRLLQQTLAASESRKEQSKMKRKKLTGKGKVILIAATLARACRYGERSGDPFYTAAEGGGIYEH